jgi:hypothetical protein
MIPSTRQVLLGQGFTGLYRGFTPAVLGAGPAHALYYAVYEQTKAALGARQPGRRPVTVAAAGGSRLHNVACWPDMLYMPDRAAEAASDLLISDLTILRGGIRPPAVSNKQL